MGTKAHPVDSPDQNPKTERRAPLPLPSVSPLEPPADIEDRLAQIGVSLSARQLALLGDYFARLLAMNEQVNLTSITDPAEVWSRHGLDALTLVPYLVELAEGARVLDVGSGGGVPGLVLAIARPDLAVTLLDATEKKVAFLGAVAEALRLDRVTALAGRAEKLATSDLARSFDVVTARAVARIDALLPWTAPFVKRGGRVLLIKGERADIEISDAVKSLKRHGCVHERTDLTPTGRIVVLRAR